MADEKAKFHETQIASDGRRYPVDKIDEVNEKLAKGEEVDAVEFEEVSVEQEGSGTVADGKQGDELSGDHTPGTPNVTRDLDGKVVEEAGDDKPAEKADEKPEHEKRQGARRA